MDLVTNVVSGTNADGSKFGKSESGNVWLDAARTSPYQMYQYWLQTADADAVRYLGPKSLEEIVTAIQSCDVGVIPNRNNAFTEINTPTRIAKYVGDVVQNDDCA